MQILRFVIITITTFITGVVLIFVFFAHYIYADKKTEANILVVEGWMPPFGLHAGYQEFTHNHYDYILVTGSAFPQRITLFVNCFAIFYPHTQPTHDTLPREISFYVRAGSTLGMDDPAHFNFWINNEKIAKYYTTQHNGRYLIHWHGRPNDIDSLMIQYTNDTIGRMGDRNLVIIEFTMDTLNLMVENADVFLDRGRPFGQYRWNHTARSFAELSAHFFKGKEIDEDKIVPISNHFDDLRRTYGNALALKEWLLENNIEVKGVNIVTMDFHARRSWETYRRVLGKDINTGVIPVKDITSFHSRKKRARIIAREALAYMYYSIRVFPFINANDS